MNPITELLQLIGQSRDVIEAGRRGLLLAHLLAPSGTQRQLAAKLQVSPARCSQMLNTIRRNLAMNSAPITFCAERALTASGFR